MKIAAISDTHDYLPPFIFEKFANVKKILHAGDIVSEEIIIELETIAPVFAVRGNSDYYSIAQKLPQIRTMEIDGINFAIVHNLKNKNNFLNLIRMKQPSFIPEVVIYGHTHIANHEVNNNIHFINPGCAGNSRCSGAKSGAILEWETKKNLQINFVHLS